MKTNHMQKSTETSKVIEPEVNGLEEIEVSKGSGNVFADFGVVNADAEQLRGLLAAHIIQALDTRQLTVRQAETITGVAAADFSRIRNANLSRFTIDRLLSILNRLNWPLEISVQSRPVDRFATALPL